jgi:hypothetical protein
LKDISGWKPVFEVECDTELTALYDTYDRPFNRLG